MNIQMMGVCHGESNILDLLYLHSSLYLLPVLVSAPTVYFLPPPRHLQVAPILLPAIEKLPSMYSVHTVSR